MSDTDQMAEVVLKLCADAQTAVLELESVHTRCDEAIAQIMMMRDGGRARLHLLQQTLDMKAAIVKACAFLGSTAQ